MREALIVGIDYYAHLKPLRGCVNDAWAVHSKLERNEDGSINFLTPTIISWNQCDGLNYSRIAQERGSGTLF